MGCCAAPDSDQARGAPIAIPGKVKTKEPGLTSKKTVSFDNETVDKTQEEDFERNFAMMDEMKRKQTYGSDEANMFRNRVDTQMKKNVLT
jgi:hypothetical protein